MDWIQGEKFKGIADFTYSPGGEKPKDDYDKLSNTLNLSALKDLNIVYTHTLYAKQLMDVIRKAPGQFIVITHSCDCSIERYGVMRPDGHGGLHYNDNFEIPDNVHRWYSKNVNIRNDKIISIPIGLENNMWYKRHAKRARMQLRMEKTKDIKNLVYMNHKIGTNPAMRQKPYDLFEEKPWVTSARGKNPQDFKQYIKDINNHRFVISPAGNGMDTVRTWECLYMNTIPIEVRNINNQFYTDLPICFIDDWEELTEDFLIKEYVRIKAEKWNLEKLKFAYWKNLILSDKV